MLITFSMKIVIFHELKAEVNMNNLASKSQQRRLNLWHALTNQAPESLITSILESDLAESTSGMTSHARNWMLQIRRDAEQIWKEEVESSLNESKPKVKIIDDFYTPRLVGKRQRGLICEDIDCFRRFAIRSEMLSHLREDHGDEQDGKLTDETSLRTA
ncbi:hypothetical protein Aperf_G00000115074 [Anoplocephala perfoliata]